MSATGQTTRAAFWNVLTTVGSRLASLASTLILTRFLAPSVYGQISVAFVATSIASLLASLGVPQFIASRPAATRSELFHGSVAFHAAGVVALALVWAARAELGVVFGAEGAEPFMLGFVVATLVERIGQIPEGLLIRDMRFREAGLAGAASELTYAVLALVLAWRGVGAQSLVLAAVGRSVVKTALYLRLTEAREWMTPHRFDSATLRPLLSFGWPIVLARLSGTIARRGDNLAFGSLFGASRLGAYNLAYNLADVPATTVGEKIGEVMVPSFAKLPPEARPEALRRSLALLGLAVFPLAGGLSALARPLSTLLDERWRALDIRWMLAILCLLSLARPIDWVARIYLQVAGRTRTIMVQEWARAAAVILGIFAAGRLGPLAACVAVGGAFVLLAMISVATAGRAAGLSFKSLVVVQIGPLSAVIVMWAGVTAVDHYLLSRAPVGIALAADVALGAVLYPAAAWLFARPLARAFVDTLRRAARGRKGAASA